MKSLEDIYQKSIEELKPYWQCAKDNQDELIIVDAILSHYKEDINHLNLSESEVSDALTEWSFNGIN